MKKQKSKKVSIRCPDCHGRLFDITVPGQKCNSQQYELILIDSAHLFCHPKVNAFCHAGTRSVKMEALHFVRTPSYFVKAADASGKTKAINPTCAAAQEKMKTVSSRLQIHREDTVFAY